MDGALKVAADTTGFIGTFDVAGAVSTTTPKPQMSGSLGAAMALGLNIIDDKTRAYSNSGAVDAQGNVAFTALDSSTAEALTIGGSFSKGSGSSVAVSGAVSWNKVDNTVESFVQNVGGGRHVQSRNGNITLNAKDDSVVAGQAGAVALAVINTNQAFAASVGISAAVNDVDHKAGSGVRTYVDNARVATRPALACNLRIHPRFQQLPSQAEAVAVPEVGWEAERWLLVEQLPQIHHRLPLNRSFEAQASSTQAPIWR